jgi:hypothetical protein
MFSSGGKAAASASAISQLLPDGTALHQFAFPGAV